MLFHRKPSVSLHAPQRGGFRHHFVVMLREGAGPEASPTAAIIDTRSVKATESGGPCDWDAAKRLKGRKHHVAGGHGRTAAGRGRARRRHPGRDG
jgi:hypothetical protein